MAAQLVFLSDVAPYRTGGGPPRMAGVHSSLSSAARACQEVATVHGLGFAHVDSVEELSLDALARARLLVLFTIGETEWDEQQRHLVQSRVTTGEMALLGLHSATDSAYGWDGFGQLMGARFAGHPVTGELPVSVVGPAHPATAHLPSPWWFNEELYLFDGLAPDATVLLAVDPAQLSAESRSRLAAAAGPAPDSGGTAMLPLAWCIERGPMRSFYTALGHFPPAYEDGRYLEHLSGAVRWLLGADRAAV